MMDGREKRWDNVVGELEKGNVVAVTPTWKDLKIGSQSFHVQSK